VSQLKKNLIANFAGKGWIALMTLAFVPFYIKFMGIEAYGLVGFFTSLTAVFALLDMGLGRTLNRELARQSVQSGNTQHIRDLTRTLEVIYWSIAVFIALIVLMLAPTTSNYWFKPQSLSASTVEEALLLMGLAIALQFPCIFYAEGLLGLQRQVLWNGMLIGTATFRAVGAVCVLWLVSPTIQAFFAWQIAASLLQTLLAAKLLWSCLPLSAKSPKFRNDLLLGVWRFAAGMTGISVMAVILMQMDKIILSKLLTLDMFGYYGLASTLAASLYVLITPFFSAMFPRLSQLAAGSDQEALKTLYHHGCQLLAVLVLPLAAVLVFFSKEVLAIWTNDIVVSENAHLLASLLVTGTALNGLMNIPYALQLAHGWTRLAFYQNVVAVILLVPMLILGVRLYGAVGAAMIWPILNSGYVLFGIQLMHRRLLKSEKSRWYFQDVALPMVSSITVAWLARLLLPEGMSNSVILMWLLAITCLSFTASACVTPYTRNLLVKLVGKYADRGANAS
jgi:O-antigen/teichoic acid export membrane protein